MLHLVAALLCARLVHAETATATFTKAGSGMVGTVVLNAGTLTMNLNLSAVNTSDLPANCLDQGLKYHLHEKWVSVDDTDVIGENLCASSMTGGHFDPYAACAGPSGNPNCDATPCLNLTGNKYSCAFSSDIYSCEVGDWSGKYGKFTWDNMTMTGSKTSSSFYEVTSKDVVGKSIVFHCGGGGQRVLCAPFIIAGDREANAVVPTPAGTAWAGLEANSASSIAFKSDGSVRLITSDLSGYDSVPTACTSLDVWLYEKWDDTENTLLWGTDCSEAKIGKVWDATNLCPPDSNNVNCDASSGDLCGDSSNAYSCSLDTDRYGCSPADVLGSSGQAPIAPGTPGDLMLKQFNMYAVAGLYNKAVALRCTNDNSIAVCAKIVSGTPAPITPTPVVSPAPTSAPVADDGDAAASTALEVTAAVVAAAATML